MPDPLMIQGLQAAQPAAPAVKTGPTVNAEGKSFKDVLVDSLNEVNRLQMEASAGVEKAVTGETDNIAEVFSAVRKADVAFSLLMEMRNKLTDAYREIQQMRV